MFNEKQFNGMWENARCGLSKSNEEKPRYEKSEKRMSDRELKRLEKEARQEYYKESFSSMFDDIADKISRW